MSTSDARGAKSRSSSRESQSSAILRRVMEKLSKKQKKTENSEKPENLLGDSGDENLGEPIASGSGVQQESEESWFEEDGIGATEKRKNKGKGIGKGLSRKSRAKPKVKELLHTDSEQSDTDCNFTKEEIAAHVNYTRANPLGKALLQLLEDNLNLQERCGIKQSSLSGQQLCSSFYMQMEQEKMNVRLAVQESAKDTENRILVRELDAVSVTNEDTVPPHFSSRPKLTSSQSNVEAMRLFPTRVKFSGGQTPDSLSVQEFFANLKSAQESMKLTESEFLKMMLLCTSGRAHDLVSNWVTEGNDCKTIFFNLSLQFDRRVTADEARQKLLNLTAPKNTDLAKHCALILQLATRASHCLPAGPSRTAYFNNEAIQCLQRSLPHNSRILCSNTFHTLSAKAGRAITYSELTRSLLTLRTTIDQDIRSNGSGSNHSATPTTKPNTATGKYKNGKSNRQSRFNTYAVDVDPLYKMEEPCEYVQNRYPKNKGNRGNKVEPAVVVYQNSASGNSHGNQHNSGPGNRPTNGEKNNRPKGRFVRQPNKKNSYCSLCGMNNHVAAQGCRNMVDQNGRVVQVQPSQSVCGSCPPGVNPRLNHPPLLCPFRINGPLYGSR